MKPGIYKAKLIGAGISPGSSDQLQPWMKFENEAGETIVWYGHITEKAKARTAEALTWAGFTGVDWNDLSKGMSAFQPNEVMITVAEETYKGKTRTKVNWVNGLDHVEKVVKMISAGEVKSKASDPGLFSKIRKEIGIKTEDEIPF
jgi:hypothetical protein